MLKTGEQNLPFFLARLVRSSVSLMALFRLVRVIGQSFDGVGVIQSTNLKILFHFSCFLKFFPVE